MNNQKIQFYFSVLNQLFRYRLRLPWHTANTYKDKMVAICKQVFVIGLEEHDRRRKEVEEFYFCVDDAKKENKATAIRTIDEFKKYKKKVCITIENDGIVSKRAWLVLPEINTGVTII